MKRGLSGEEASVYVEALRGIGARVELKPAHAVSASAGRPPSLAAPREPVFQEDAGPPLVDGVIDGVPGTEWGGLQTVASASGGEPSASELSGASSWDPSASEASPWEPSAVDSSGSASAFGSPSTFEEEVVAPRDLSTLEQDARESRRPAASASTPPLPADWADLPGFDDGPASFDAWDGSLALADVAPARRPSAAPAPVLVAPASSPSSRPSSIASSTAPTSFTPDASIGELESSSQPVVVAVGQLLGGLLLLGVGSFGRGGLFGGLTMASGAGLVVLGAANLVRALVFRLPAWDSLLPRAASFLVGFCIVGFFTLRSAFVVDEREMAEIEAVIQAELAAGEEADAYLRRNPTHRFGSLTPANSVALVGALKARGATAVTLSEDDVFGNVVGGVAVRMPSSEAQRAQIRQTAWNAVRASAQASGYSYEDFVAEPLQGDWWSIWFLVED
ncbi:MAG: hypothetical protein H6721_33285 [Sandaracinus sp.]|nr:hypothetical protein [Sandaracinus sp.]MCB9619144.1 hypothetical protein [Sandaracinus sp.]MCB9632727.1 hypothetical protein [Sandaracinus sp.]MCB9637008.1 hypothetical protein [Sandaracinus sp.]